MISKQLFFISACMYASFAGAAGNISLNAQATIIEQENVGATRLSVVQIKNESNATFKVYYDAGACKGIITPQSTLHLGVNDIMLQQNKLLQINCVSGPYQPMYIQDGCKASGTAPAGFHGPYVLDVWLSYPQVAQKEKMSVSYVVAEHHTGEIMIVIDAQGSVQVQTVQHVKIV